MARAAAWAFILMGCGGLAAGGAAAREIHVTTTLMAFTPAVIKARVGDRVVWNNGGDVTHELYFPKDPGSRDRPYLVFILRNGQDVSLRLTTPGDYDYYCRWHGMRGMIHVAPQTRALPRR
jgi:plastocyanin